MRPIAKAGLNLIPLVGGMLASLIGDFQSKRNEKRLKEFLKTFAEDMNQRIDSIQKEYINNPEFVDIFLNILDDAMKQRKSDKRVLLKNLLVNSITMPNTSYDDTEEFERMPNGSFVKKLYSLYLSYLPVEKIKYALKMNVDDRGSFTELVHTEDCGQVSINISRCEQCIYRSVRARCTVK